MPNNSIPSGESFKILALHLADQLNIKSVVEQLPALFNDGVKQISGYNELFLYEGTDRAVYVFSYGVVVYTGFSPDEAKELLSVLGKAAVGEVRQRYRDDYIVRVDTGAEMSFGFDTAILPHLDTGAMRMVMFGLAQSVALDYYLQLSEELLFKIKDFARELEMRGKLSISKKNMMKFMGRALTTKNRIAENHYVFDAPDIVWESEYLEKINTGMSRSLDLSIRFKEIDYTFRTIEENLVTFRDLLQHRESSILEWIIIILILIEIIDMLVVRVLT